MVALKTPLRNTKFFGEHMELVQRVVAHQMAPESVAPPPVRGVDEQSHPGNLPDCQRADVVSPCGDFRNWAGRNPTGETGES